MFKTMDFIIYYLYRLYILFRDILLNSRNKTNKRQDYNVTKLRVEAPHCSIC